MPIDPASAACREISPAPTDLKRLLQGEFRPGVAIVGATLVAELGVFFLACFCGLALRESTMAMLMAAAVWTALAGPALAASGSDLWRSFVRGGLVADATGASLLAVWACWTFARPPQEAMSAVSILKVYCTYGSMAVFAAMAVGCVRGAPWRFAAAAGVSVFLMLALASPFWSGGLIAATEGPLQQNVVAWAVWINPFYSITSAMVDSLHYVIHQEAVLYQITLIGDYAAPPAYPWFSATAIYLPLGLAMLLIGRLAGSSRGGA